MDLAIVEYPFWSHSMKILKAVPLPPLDTGQQHLAPFCQYHTEHRQQEVGSSSEIKFLHTKYRQNWWKRVKNIFVWSQKDWAASRSPVRLQLCNHALLSCLAWVSSKWRENSHAFTSERKRSIRLFVYEISSAIKVSLIKMPYQSIENCSYTYLMFL